MNYYYVYQTPIGELTVAEKDCQLAGIYFNQEMLAQLGEKKETEFLADVKQQLDEYFLSKRRNFDLPLMLKGTEFQKKVWKQLLCIPYGSTTTYGEIAKELGNEKAARAVGLANHKNPIAIVVPCHRVIGKNGNLVGYAGGVDIKEKLLKIEQQST